MPISTFNPAVRPSPGTSSTNELSLNKTSFGDGYAQTSPRGLNHIRKSVTLRWDALTLDQAKDLETFFVGLGGVTPFYYTLRWESAARKWTCEEWAITDGSPFSFTATLKENFTLTV